MSNRVSATKTPTENIIRRPAARETLRGAWSVWQGCDGTVSSGEEKTVSLAGALRFTALFSGRDIFTLFQLFLRVTTTDAMDAKHTQRDQQAKEPFHEKQHVFLLI